MSAVIYVAIVVMWAVVLVPMWLRRHDAVAEQRSAEKFSGAMSSLGRRQLGTAGRRSVVMPRRSPSYDVHVSGAADHAPPPVPAPLPRRVASRPSAPRAKASLAVRRRRLLVGLVAVAVLSFVLSVAGFVPWPVQVVFDIVVALDLAHLRTQARRNAPVRSTVRSRSVAAARGQAASTVREPLSVAAAAAALAAEREVARWAEDAEVDYVRPDVTAGGLAADVAELDDDSWQPVPVPPPTYTMKPAAPRRRAYLPPDDYPLVPSVGSPAAASADAPAVEPAAARAAGAVADGDLDDILEHRWAVND